MKKMLTVVLTLIMAVGLLTGCKSDPVAKEFSKFLNEDMAGVDKNYEKLVVESKKWNNIADEAALITSLKDVVLPTLNESLEMISKIELQTEEVKEIKEKYKKVLETYKEGYEKMLSAVETNDEAAAETAEAKIDEALKLIDDYNKALETLAKEKDMKIEY